MAPHLKVWKEKYARSTGARRLLACDGGGILGIMSLEILAEIEKQLADMTGEGDAFRLGKFFDYVAGTSTGAIIAAGLAVGMTVEELTDFYVKAGPQMFEKRFLLRRLRSFYSADPLRKMLIEVLGERTLGAKDLECLLLIVTRNATTDSPWPVCNNPFAKYNDRNRPDCNLQIPLWQLVRASTAAPVYFPPEFLQWQPGDPDKSFVFVDGGVTPYNDPAFLLYRMATVAEYGLEWPSGENNMMLVSIGTGSAARVDHNIDLSGDLVAENLARLPGILMGGAAVDQDINCRTFGRCVFGQRIDREIGDLIPRTGPRPDEEIVPEQDDPNREPLKKDLDRAFLYARYDPDVSADGLARLGLHDIDPDKVQAMDKVEHLEEMQLVGQKYAAKCVDMSPFKRFVQDREPNDER